MSRPVYRCQKCSSENVTFMADVTISAPMEFYHNLSKRALEKRRYSYGELIGIELIQCARFPIFHRFR